MTVIPAHAGIHVIESLDPGIRRGDEWRMIHSCFFRVIPWPDSERD